MRIYHVRMRVRDLSFHRPYNHLKTQSWCYWEDLPLTRHPIFHNLPFRGPDPKTNLAWPWKTYLSGKVIMIIPWLNQQMFWCLWLVGPYMLPTHHLVAKAKHVDSTPYLKLSLRQVPPNDYLPCNIEYSNDWILGLKMVTGNKTMVQNA